MSRYVGGVAGDWDPEPPEPLCGERYGVQDTVCLLAPGHGGWHDDGVGQWPTQPSLPASASGRA